MRLLYMALLVSGFAYSQSFSETVYFGYDSHNLSATEQAKVKRLAAALDTVNITNLMITAYCDDRGSTAYNRVLSLQRAETVAMLLAKQGAMQVGGGELPLQVGADTISQRDRNRRAEILINYLPVAKPVVTVVSSPPQPEASRVPPADSATVATVAEPIEYRRIDERDFLPGDRILLNNIQFISGKSVLVKRSERELINLLLFMQRNPNVIVEIQGHVCCIADYHKDAVDEDTYTPNLSENRAKKIYDYLIRKGIPAERMTYKGYGRQFPIPGAWEEDNKRVEILVTGMLDN